MAQKRSSELIVGIFVVGALAAAIGVLVWLGAADMLLSHGQEVGFTLPRDRGSIGLVTGSAIKVNDTYLGKISRIQYDAEHGQTVYIARLERKDVRVYRDARASAVAEFIGVPAVVIENFGTVAAGEASAVNGVSLDEAPNAMLRQAQDALGYGDQQKKQFQEIIANAALASERVKVIADKVACEVNDGEENTVMRRVKTILVSLQSGAADAAGILAKVRPDVEDTIAAIHLYTKTDLAAILADVRKAETGIIAVIADVQTVSAKARDLVATNADNIDQTIINLKSTSTNLDAAAKEIRRNPWRLMQTPDNRELRSQNLYDAARVFAEGAGQLGDAMTRLEAIRKAHGDAAAANDPDVQKMLKSLQLSSERFHQAEEKLWKELQQ